ncbi:LuxR C-terminal-related transcriptional regulator [Actinotignum urinale]|uniref:response regulator transcription factor n=1 Tax=Actinotignum urinale TaxID=190146 RepID=UPI001CA4AD0A|nr:LuxR C-terminal-related transcriptional regulator [Actinotignum urinale]WIK59472.1 LuxR C-terminal-related transcriptional regulator [Actinotignum urinale]
MVRSIDLAEQIMRTVITFDQCTDARICSRQISHLVREEFPEISAVAIFVKFHHAPTFACLSGYGYPEFGDTLVVPLQSHFGQLLASHTPIVAKNKSEVARLYQTSEIDPGSLRFKETHRNLEYAQHRSAVIQPCILNGVTYGTIWLDTWRGEKPFTFTRPALHRLQIIAKLAAHLFSHCTMAPLKQASGNIECLSLIDAGPLSLETQDSGGFFSGQSPEQRSEYLVESQSKPATRESLPPQSHAPGRHTGAPSQDPPFSQPSTPSGEASAHQQILETVVLSRREQQVLYHISQGLTNAAIAEQLFISTNTVRTHRRSLMSKLNATNATCLLNEARKRHLID